MSAAQALAQLIELATSHAEVARQTGATGRIASLSDELVDARRRLTVAAKPPAWLLEQAMRNTAVRLWLAGETHPSDHVWRDEVALRVAGARDVFAARALADLDQIALYAAEVATGVHDFPSINPDLRAAFVVALLVAGLDRHGAKAKSSADGDRVVVGSTPAIRAGGLSIPSSRFPGVSPGADVDLATKEAGVASAEPLRAAIAKKEAAYEAALDLLTADADSEEADRAKWELREALELVRCLRRLLEGRSREEVYRAFGAPGDFGYHRPIGDALAAIYHAPASKVGAT